MRTSCRESVRMSSFKKSSVDICTVSFHRLSWCPTVRAASNLQRASFMKHLFTTLIAVGLLSLAPSQARAQVSFGVRIGTPPPPRNYAVPPRPGPDYEWVGGYWY